MIRFIDLTDQICEGEKEFAFFDTISGVFLCIGGCYTFDNEQNFIESYNSRDDSPYQLDRFTSLIPERFKIQNCKDEI